MSDEPAPLDELRQRFRVQLGRRAHLFGDDGRTLCGLDPLGATEASAALMICPRCDKQWSYVQDLSGLRAEVATLSERLQASRSAEAKVAERLSAVYASEGAAQKEVALLKKEAGALKTKNAALLKAARMWRAIVEGEAVPGDGSDEDYLLARPVSVPRFAK